MSLVTEYAPQVIVGLLIVVIFMTFIAVLWMKTAKECKEQLAFTKKRLSDSETSWAQALDTANKDIVRAEELKIQLAEQVAEQLNDLNAYKIEASKYNELMSQAADALNKANESIEKNNNRIEQLETELSFNTRTVDNYAEVNANQLERIQLLSKENFEYANSNAGLIDRIQFLTDEHKELTDKIAVLTAPISTLRVRSPLKKVAEFMYLPVYKILLTERELKQATKRFNSAHIIVD